MPEALIEIRKIVNKIFIEYFQYQGLNCFSILSEMLSD